MDLKKKTLSMNSECGIKTSITTNELKFIEKNNSINCIRTSLLLLIHWFPVKTGNY